MFPATHAPARHPAQVVRLHPAPRTALPGVPVPVRGGTAQVLALFPRPLPAPIHAAVVFTMQDRIDLLSWYQGGGSGYVRLVVEDGRPGDAPDRGAFALAYQDGQAFATIGLTRTPAGIQAWRCADGEVVGLHPTMAAALAALPPG